MHQKNNYISSFTSKGKFVCVNCCSEFFEGPEMESPRYSYNNFFGEQDWKDMPLVIPSHHPEAREKKYVPPFHPSIHSFICRNPPSPNE